MLGHARNRNGTTRPGSNVCRGRGALKLGRPGDGKGRERGEAEAGPTECAVRRFRRIFFFSTYIAEPFPRAAPVEALGFSAVTVTVSAAVLAWLELQANEKRKETKVSGLLTRPALPVFFKSCQQ